jgi:hypothetical protein
VTCIPQSFASSTLLDYLCLPSSSPIPGTFPRFQATKVTDRRVMEGYGEYARIDNWLGQASYSNRTLTSESDRFNISTADTKFGFRVEVPVYSSETRI